MLLCPVMWRKKQLGWTMFTFTTWMMYRQLLTKTYSPGWQRLKNADWPFLRERCDCGNKCELSPVYLPEVTSRPPQVSGVGQGVDEVFRHFELHFYQTPGLRKFCESLPLTCYRWHGPAKIQHWVDRPAIKGWPYPNGEPGLKAYQSGR